MIENRRCKLHLQVPAHVQNTGLKQDKTWVRGRAFNKGQVHGSVCTGSSPTQTTECTGSKVINVSSAQTTNRGAIQATRPGRSQERPDFDLVRRMARLQARPHVIHSPNACCEGRVSPGSCKLEMAPELSRLVKDSAAKTAELTPVCLACGPEHRFRGIKLNVPCTAKVQHRLVGHADGVHRLTYPLPIINIANGQRGRGLSQLMRMKCQADQ